MRGDRCRILACLWVTALATAAEARESPDLKSLELRVWTAEDAELPLLENEVVRAAQLDPHSAVAHQLLAHVLVRNFTRDPGDLYTLKQASDLAQQAVDLAPKKDHGYVAMAEILDLMGNSDRGLKLLDDAEQSGVEPSWRLFFTRARLAADQASAVKVLALYEKALGFPDAEPRIIVPYVVAMLQAESSGEDLVERLASWNTRFPSALFDLTMAITYAELGQHRRAHELYTAIVKKNPSNKEAKVNDAILLYRDLKEGAKAAALLEGVLAQHGKELSEPIMAMIRAHLAACYATIKQWDKAEGEFLRAVAADHRNLSILDFMSRSYKEAKAHQRLVTVLRRLNDTMPGTSVTHALLGETLSETLAQHDAALRAYADAITLEPGRSDYYNGMGLAYYRKKSYDQALKLFAAATEVDPNDATARYNHACVLSLLGRADEALATLGEALALDPGLMKNAQSDGDFANIRGHLRFRELVTAPTAAGLPATAIGH